jgi:hypothetical protein
MKGWINMNKKIIILLISTMFIVTNIEGISAITTKEIISENKVTKTEITKNLDYYKDINLNLGPLGGDGITNRFAVIIGTDNSVFCQNDANDMSQILGNCGWKLKVYKGKEASKKNILNGIQWLADQSDNDDIVLFYFSGHGSTRVIADYDFEPIFLIELKIAFLKIKLLTTQVLIFDTCHAGSLNVGAEVPGFKLKYFNYNGEFPENDLEFKKSGFFGFNGIGRVVLASCRGFQYSYGDPKFKNGIFTYYLIEAFNNNNTDTNDNGWISEREAFDYAQTKTRERSSLFIQWPEIVKDTNLGQVDLIKFRDGTSRNKIYSILENIRLLKHTFCVIN